MGELESPQRRRGRPTAPLPLDRERLASDHLGVVELPADPASSATPSFAAVLRNRSFRALWIAQILSQFAQNLTWITLGAFVAHQTGKNTLVSVIIVTAMMAQLFLSGFAGVLVDRVSKRAVLLGSNLLRVVMVVLFVAATSLEVTVQTTTIIVLIFLANAIAQFFAPAEAATIPLIVERSNLIAASSLFNITFNACQVLPVTLGLLIYELLGIVPVLIGVGACYLGAALLVATLPPATTTSHYEEMMGSFGEAAGHVVGDLREALRFLSENPGLRLTIFQINIAPSFLFIFGSLGLIFVRQTFGLDEAQAWILLLPAGAGLVVGAVSVGRISQYVRKEDLINVGLLVMGVGVAVLGAVAVVVRTVDNAAGRVGGLITGHIHRLPPVPDSFAVLRGLIPPAMLIAFIIGLAMSLSTIPAQTLVFERTSEAIRGRVLSMQQLIGGALPIIPLLTTATLADLYGTSNVMTALGVLIVAIGALSVYADHRIHH